MDLFILVSESSRTSKEDSIVQYCRILTRPDLLSTPLQQPKSDLSRRFSCISPSASQSSRGDCIPFHGSEKTNRLVACSHHIAYTMFC